MDIASSQDEEERQFNSLRIIGPGDQRIGLKPQRRNKQNVARAMHISFRHGIKEMQINPRGDPGIPKARGPMQRPMQMFQRKSNTTKVTMAMHTAPRHDTDDVHSNSPEDLQARGPTQRAEAPKERNKTKLTRAMHIAL